MFEFVALLRPDLWKLDKKASGCDLYRKEGGSDNPCFRLHCVIDWPPEIAFEFIKDPVKRI